MASSSIFSSSIFTAISTATSGSTEPATPVSLPTVSLHAHTLTPSLISTPTPIQPPQSSEDRSQNGLKAGEIAAITVAAFALFLAVVAVTIFVCVRRRRHQRDRFGYDEGGAEVSTIHSTEKYGEDGDGPYPEYRLSVSENGGMAPLLESKSQRRSQVDSEKQPLHDDEPASPFIIGKFHDMPQANTVSLADAIPLNQYDIEAQLEVATLLPSTLPSSSESKGTLILPPLTIPQYNAPPPTRRPSRGKRSVRSSRYASRILEGYDSDDSASLYSQASASTIQSLFQRASFSAMRSYPVPPLPSSQFSSPTDTESNELTPTGMSGSPNPISSSSSPVSLSAPLVRTTEHIEEPNERYSVIAGLLKSRVGPSSKTPSRSSSLISHIERKDSIKAAISPIGKNIRESYGRRFARMKHARDAQRVAEKRSSVVHELPESSSDRTMDVGTAGPRSSLVES